MEISRENILSLQIEEESDIGVCRRKAVSLAKQIGLDEVKTGEVAILVTELATNVIKHGGGKGKISVCHIKDDRNQVAIEIWCCDTGMGIPNMEKAMKDGYTTANSLGIGMGSIRRFSDELDFNPVSETGQTEKCSTDCPHLNNCIRTRKWVPNKYWEGSNKKLAIGAVSRAKPGEKFNGDCYIINHFKPGVSIFSVIDGLGHGKEANWASQIGKETIIKNSSIPLADLMIRIHNSMKGTRGATVGLIQLDTENQKLRYTGIGNIESFLISQKNKKTLLSYGGIVGHNIRSPRVFEYDFKPGDSICMYSDGITSRWKLEDISLDEHPQKNAELIINQYSRLNDDATVLIIRYNS